MKRFGISRENNKIVYEFEMAKHLSEFSFCSYFPISNLFSPFLGMGLWMGKIVWH